ncbi:hypothetical protein VTJ49DRAFT_1179 [Mycothermus thermophilus]|uniref:Uncharacterized protein n=1 Tax=Humicola insolens TaxID=85995 RepID=A0ABR3VEC0_HUMIN
MADADETIYPPGHHYSGTHRVPNIQQLVESLDPDKKSRDAAIDHRREQRQDHAAPSSSTPSGGKASPTSDQNTKSSSKNRRTVHDPVTGREVEIEDISSHHLKAVSEPKITVPNANLEGKDTTTQTKPEQSGEEYRIAQDVTAPPDPVAEGATSDLPIHGEKTNVLFHPTPSVSYEPMFRAVEQRAEMLCAGLFVGIVWLGKIGGGSLWLLVPLAAGVASGVFLWARDLVRRGRAGEWYSEKRRGETAVVNLIPESVEWLNAAVGLVWGLINPDMFAAVADTLEDVMQASLPKVVEHVKVNDLSQGSNPLRILSLRALPDGEVEELRREIHERDKKVKDPEELAAEEGGGDFYNLEATVAYHAEPSGADVSSKAKNMGMQVVLYPGVKGLFGVPFPIWVELQRLVATVRLRLSLGPDPPFIKTLSFTLMGLPKVEASCVPLVRRGANILNLPLISRFVNWAIAAAASMYVAPKSMTLDVGKLVQGDTVKKETNALGVLFVRIHKAVGLSKQDHRGSQGGGSDPYICVSFSKFAKPLYCTRVIQDNLNPVFSECCALLVTPDVIKADERLSLELWDSDRSSADDVVGKVTLSIQKLMQHPGKMFPQTSALRGVKADSTMPGELHWEVGFFGKTQFRTALRTDGLDPSLPPALRARPELQDERGTLDTAHEDAVMHTPPDPLWPSGILSVVVHQIVNLEVQNIRGSQGGDRSGTRREFAPARPEAGDMREETGTDLPSAYCTILVNDELVYKTRTKAVSSRPIFEAGTEKFVRDWRACVVTVTVRDSRHREHDPILGVVPLRLADVLRARSQCTRWYPLAGGIGFGRVRISLLFRSVELKLPPAQVGYGDVGTFEFTDDVVEAVGYCPSEKTKMRMRTGGSSASVKRHKCRRSDDGDGLTWDVRVSKSDKSEEEEDKSETTPSARIRLPVRFRYRSPIFFSFHTPKHGVGGIRPSKADAYASLWLQDVPDTEEQAFDIPIWRCSNPTRLSQNYITADNVSSIPDLDVQEVGRLRFRGRFKPGADRDHARFVVDNDSRETVETWEACYAEGARGEVVQAEVPEEVQKLHEESLEQGRDVLAAAPEGDKEKWLHKDGEDWSAAFQCDPGELVENGEAERMSAQSSVVREESSSSSSSEDEEGDVDLGIVDATHGNNKEKERKESEAGSSEEGNYTWKPSRDDDEDRPSGDSNEGEEPGKSSGSKNPLKQFREFRGRKKDLHRKHRGLMQWKPMRNIQFAKDEAVFAARRVMRVGSLTGRTPDVETEV